ncbi:30S ribosomal protein S6 [Candidatus Absconditicoccus praedator]|uniref:30S ribosomal protein S6 n=1 Tax=Candidatus Absconditicoccus praedator TaxID=2735562 RepID=UPI001E3D4D60|nr:30S ribosomal protein S6 [Candidatus Absconditicoccus praedator]UFX82533.1 30S ribosomal protein S6 [Candidatus Absconditicoccus praedator]
MNIYELVIMVDTNMKKDDIDSTIKEVESVLGDSVKEKDDIGILDLYHAVKGNDRCYFVSYMLSAAPESIEDFEKAIKLNKSILRYVFFRLKNEKEFLKYDEVNKQFQLTEEEKAQQDAENAFKDFEKMNKAK